MTGGDTGGGALVVGGDPEVAAPVLAELANGDPGPVHWIGPDATPGDDHGATVVDGVGALAPAVDAAFDGGPPRVLVTLMTAWVPGAGGQVATAGEIAMAETALGTVVPAMAEAGYGRVVVVVASTGVWGFDRWDDGRATVVGALTGLAQMAARKVTGAGVTVNVVRAGLLDTERLGVARAEDPDVATAIDAALAETPTRRLGTPDDVAAAVGFLASADASYVSGLVLPVDGGMSMGLGAA